MPPSRSPPSNQPPSATRVAAYQPPPPPPRKRALSSSTNATPLSAGFGTLILEIAARLEPLSTIIKRHGISKAEFIKLRQTPVFIAALADQVKAFNGLDNIPNRVRLKAQLLTEVLLDDMFSIASQSAYPSSSRVAAFAQVKQLTGMDRPDNVAPPQKFSLTINLDKRSITVETAQTLSQDLISADGDDPNDPPLAELSGLAGYDPLADDDFDPEIEAMENDALVPAPIQDRGWNSFTAKPGPPLDKPGPPAFERRLPNSATTHAAALDDD